MERHTYRTTLIPDPAYPPHVLATSAGVRAAVWDACEHLTRTLAAFPAGSASIALRFLYRPAGEGRLPHQRLTLELVGHAHAGGVAGSLSLLLDRTPLRKFYALRRPEASPVDMEPFQCACDVVRRHILLEPTVSPELNALALPMYYGIEPFEPREDNDCLMVDRTLGGLEEPVLIEVCVEPVDIRKQLAAHTAYLARLQQINRPWDTGDDDLPDLQWRSRAESRRTFARAEPKTLRMREPLVDDFLRRQQRFHESLSKPHLSFHVRVMAQTQATAMLVASVVAEGAFEEGSYGLIESSRTGLPPGDPARGRDGLRAVPAPIINRVPEEGRIRLYEDLWGLGNLTTVDEFVGAFRRPVASHGSPCCIRKNTDPEPEDPGDLIILGYEEAPDSVAAGEAHRGIARGIRVGNLRKHVFLSGMTGSGKTVLDLNIVYQLLDRRIPFIVFEPVKTHYRALKCLRDHPDPSIRRLAQDLRIYTPGNEAVSPIRLNPLRIPEGISQDEHIENLFACFKAVMPMSGPLQALICEALEEVYEEHPNPANPPRMRNLYAAARRVLASKRYSGEVNSNLRGALDVRLGSITRRAMGRIFQCEGDIPGVDELMQGFSIIEMDALVPEQACLLTLFILTAIRERIKTVLWSGDGLRLVLVLEEAHNLAGREQDARPSEENADPKAFASEFIARMLAEVRGLGVGFVIVDQSASAVAPQVTKGTVSKGALMQVDEDERETIGATALFGPIEMEEIARLRPGEGYFFTEGYFGPRRIRVRNLPEELGLGEPPFGGAILPYIREDRWFVEAAGARASMELGRLMLEMDGFDKFRATLSGEMRRLILDEQAARKVPDEEKRKSLLQGIAGRASKLRDRFRAAFQTFERYSYRPLMGRWTKENLVDDSIHGLWAELSKRFEERYRKGTFEYMRRLDGLALRCLKGS